MATLDATTEQKGQDMGALLAQLSAVLGGLGIPQGNIDLILGFVGSNPSVAQQLVSGADISAVAAISGMNPDQLMGREQLQQALQENGVSVNVDDQGNVSVTFQDAEKAIEMRQRLAETVGYEDIIVPGENGTSKLTLTAEQVAAINEQQEAQAAKPEELPRGDLGEQSPRTTPEPGDGAAAFINSGPGREL